jgi:predicted acetyltransferase
VTVSVRDARASREQRRWLEAAYGEWLLEMGASAAPVDVAAAELARWLEADDAAVMLVMRDHEPAGFAVITWRGAKERPDEYRMVEFFVTRAHRRGGVGRAAVCLLLDRFAGHWQIAEPQGNTTAVAFWRSVVAQYTHGKFRERVADGQVFQLFLSGPERLRRA